MIQAHHGNFDNREFHSTARYWFYPFRGQLHLMFEFEGYRVVYAYIRKNACTSFKRYLLEKAGILDSKGKKDIYLLLNLYRADFHRDFKSANRTIFIHRDPIDRVVSLYRDKFVQGKNAVDIYCDYERVVGENARKATFEAFALRYLPAAKDPHTWTQRSHLYPSVYSDAVPIEVLYEFMQDILSSDVADLYFKRPVNASRGHAIEVPNASSIGAHEIRENLEQTGTYPSRESFVLTGGKIHLSLLEKYAEDQAFLRKE
ncbi:sulfotransferase family 2 domain-containing protein [Porifericola rhodea]|uniref:sulfotransferase family 2 domain-containing protein n=1 Tax=Porifericola rhodea TaxID=930972 RepID=UPI002665D5C3|nr:sulfotransferase family 2 domain-containing protein [Porifericola rhodea]WKN29770.1 sulfotransferase family 2 domain-containing protein [Porifericola rhodea]